MVVRDPFLTRGRPVGVGRYDGDPASHAALGAGLPAKARSTQQRGPTGSYSTTRAAALVDEVRQHLLLEKAQQENGGAQGLAELAPLAPVEPALHFHSTSVAVLVAVPWGVFTLVTALFALTRPATFWSGLAYFVAIVSTLIAGVLIVVHLSLEKGKVYYYLGLLCLLSVAMGCMAGHILYDRDMAEYWLNQARSSRSNVAPTDYASSYRDAASLTFTDGARVDLHRVMGSRSQEDRHTYCVAPILDETQLDHVEFWAVGVDCCEPLWGFYCGDVLLPSARSGAVLPAAASDYTGRRYARYWNTAHQAAALYHLTVADEPVFVHWLEDPSTERSRELRDGAVGVLLFSIAYFFASLLLAVGLHWHAGRKPATRKALTGLPAGVEHPALRPGLGRRSGEPQVRGDGQAVVAGRQGQGR